jgi:MFS family permease
MKETEGDGKGNSPKRMALLVIPVRTVIDRGNFCMYSLPSVTAWPVIIISIAEGIVTSIARSSLDGLLADVIPEDARGKAQANYTAAGLIVNLIGATAAGLLYGYSTGLHFLIEGLRSKIL